jgi:hypothetical protein
MDHYRQKPLMRRNQVEARDNGFFASVKIQTRFPSCASPAQS